MGARPRSMRCSMNGQRSRSGEPVEGLVRFGTVDWLFREYKQSEGISRKGLAAFGPITSGRCCWLRTLSPRRGPSRRPEGQGDHAGLRRQNLRAIIAGAPRSAPAPRRKGGGVMSSGLECRASPLSRRFRSATVPNPWRGVTKHRRTKASSPLPRASRSTHFAWGGIERGHPEAGAAAVICFEWLQRPENVLAGYIRWTDYRGKEWPSGDQNRSPQDWRGGLASARGSGDGGTSNSMRMQRRCLRRAAASWHSDDPDESGSDEGRHQANQVYAGAAWPRSCARLRDKVGLPTTFTLDACRHGGMTELEEAELTDGQGRALSAHKSRGIRGLREANDGTRALGNSQAPRSQARERERREQNIRNEPRNDISE